jgi:hypothetical protein
VPDDDKIAEKLDFQSGTTVEVCKNRKPTTLLRATICGSGNFSDKICKKTSEMYNSRNILLLLWNWNAWLRSQAFNIGNIG